MFLSGSNSHDVTKCLVYMFDYDIKLKPASSSLWN